MSVGNLQNNINLIYNLYLFLYKKNINSRQLLYWKVATFIVAFRGSIRSLNIKWNLKSDTLLFCVKLLSHQSVMPQRFYSILNTCQRTVELPRHTPKNIKFASYSVYTTSSQHPYRGHTTFPQRLYGINDAFTAQTSCCSAHGTHTAFSQWS